MKIMASATALFAGLRHLRPANRNPHFGPVVRILASNDEIQLSAAGRELAIDTHVDGAVERSGFAVVPFTPLLALLDRCGQNDVEISSATTARLDIGSSALEASLRTFDIDEWTHLRLADADSFKLSAPESGALAVVATAASTDPQRPTLSGVHLKDGLADATDTYQVVRAEVQSWRGEVVLPVSAIAAVGADEGLSVSYDGSLVRLRSSHLTVRSTTVSGSFPDTAPFFQAEVTGKAEAGRVEMIDAVKSAAALGPTDVTLQLHNDELQVSSDAPDLGRVESRIDAEGELEGVHHVTARMLLRTLENATGQSITLEMTKPGYFLIRCPAFDQLLMTRKRSATDS